MKLALFFTRGVSLDLWLKRGLLDREKLIYEEHLNEGSLSKVYWVTYGAQDLYISNYLKHAKRLHPNISVICMPKIFNFPRIGSHLYSWLVPFLYPRLFRGVDIFKTNQMDGSWSGVLAKYLYRKALLVRTGYGVSQLFCNNNRNSAKCRLFKFVEKHVYTHADLISVSSVSALRYIKDQRQADIKKVLVVRNYVDLNLFTPSNKVERYDKRILFVGRLNPEKNMFSLIEAMSDFDLSLDIYGEGDEMKKQLENFALSRGVIINFFGVVSNSRLSEVYKHYKYYILPSYHEGMPKTLIEAMASGCLCIGTNVNGINEIIVNGFNGILARDTKSESISEAIKKAIYSNDKEMLVNNGISTIRKGHALKSIVKKEISIFEDLTGAA